MNNPFKGKRITVASLWDEDEEFVQYHVQLMGGCYTDSFDGSIDYLVFDPKNDFKRDALNKARDVASKGGEIELLTFAEFQSVVYKYIKQKRLSEGKKNIDSKEFFGFSELTEVEIPEGAAYIGDYAFYMCENLVDVHIPSSVSMIGRGAFQGCYNLKSVTIDEGVAEIKESAFDTFPIWKTDSSRTSGFGTPMKNISVDKKSNLENVVLPNSLKKIGEKAFANSGELREITLPLHLEEIGAGSFYNSSVEKYYLYDSSKGEKTNLWHSENEANDYRHYYYNFQVAVLSKETGQVKYVVPMFTDGTGDMMKCLSDGWNNSNGEFDFDKLSTCFSKAKKPETKAKIADCMLSNSGRISEERLKIYNAYIKRTSKKREAKIQFDPAFEVKGSKLINYKGNDSAIAIPAGITEIGIKAFLCNRNIKEISLPEGVVSMETDTRSESHAFEECFNLERILLPNTLTNMPYGALDSIKDRGILQYNSYDNGLYLGNAENPFVCLVKTVSKDINTIVVPDGCRIVCTYAFDDCPNLESISLPDSIVRIEDEGFHSKWNPRKDVYLRRNLSMNMPNGYLRRAEKIPSTLIYDLVTTKWRDEVTIEDYVWLYLYQGSKTLDELCEKKMGSDPNRAVAEMNLALNKHPKKASYKKRQQSSSQKTRTRSIKMLRIHFIRELLMQTRRMQ